MIQYIPYYMTILKYIHIFIQLHHEVTINKIKRAKHQTSDESCVMTQNLEFHIILNLHHLHCDAGGHLV